ncbi:Choline transport protein [Lachnellula occidentalis]|uniref:Choline transport protein n=1 Tax=Lachnellula occidentalis TaxID=215460 RepID=A0A8H8S7X5_9HELO|nr:Choline transport protein [Lachnellula occidentalis]
MTDQLPMITKSAFIWSLVGFTVISITVLACSSPDYSSAEFVFTEFLNEASGNCFKSLGSSIIYVQFIACAMLILCEIKTGWPDGISWLLGLLQAGLGLTGFDAVAHMIEEIPNPEIEGPKIMIACVGIGIFTGFIFLMVLLFVAGPIDGPNGVIESTAGPLLQIFYNATKSKAGAICLLM